MACILLILKGAAMLRNMPTINNQSSAPVNEKTLISEDYVVVSPAYGRDYRSAQAAKDDFLAGKDFILESLGYGGRYCSARDFAKGVKVEVRYKKLQSAVIVEVK